MTLNGLVWPELHNPLDSEWQLASISGTQGKPGPRTGLLRDPPADSVRRSHRYAP